MEPERDDRRGSLRLEGEVVDEQARPIADASVSLDGKQAVTDRHGRFGFGDLAPGLYRLGARKDDLCCEITLVTVREHRRPVTLRASAGITLVVHVRDGESPVAGARVELDHDVAISDARGVAVMRGVGPQFQMVEVKADGYAPVIVSMWLAPDPGGTIERTARLDRGAAVAGIVVAPDNTPLPNAIVRLFGPWGGHTRSDDRGAWRFERVVAGTYQLRAVSRAHAPSAELIVELDGVTAREDLVVRTELGARLAGAVVDELGAPVPGAFVAAMKHGSEELDEDTFRADEHGRFDIHGLEAGTWDVFAHHGERASPITRLSCAAGDSMTVDFVAGPSSIAGLVVDAGGNPVAGASVGVRAGFLREDLTDEAGYFELGGFPPGEYDLEARSPEQHEREPDATARVTAGTKHARLVLPALATLTGRVLLNGAPMTYFGVLVTQCPRFPWIGRPTGIHAEDGRFTLPGLGDGTWGIVIAGPGTMLHTIPELDVEPGAAIDLGDIEMVRGQRITGCVRDSAGALVAGARVTIGLRGRDRPLDPDPLLQWFHADFETTTDLGGAFAFDGVTSLRAPDARPTPISATHPTRGSSIAVAVPEGDAAVELTLVETGAIDGTLEGVWSDVASIEVVRQGEPADLRCARIERSGTFVLDRVPPGDYRLTVTALPDEPVPAPMTVTVTARQRTSVKLRS